MTIRLHMPPDDIQEIFIGLLRLNICLRIFKHTDQAYIIIVTGKRRFNILEIPQMNRHIRRIHMTIGINPAAFAGQIDAGHLRRLAGQRPRDRTAPGSHLQHFHLLRNRQPFYNVPPQRRQMIKNRPAAPLLDDPLVFDGRIVTCNLQQFIFHIPVTITVLPRIMCQIQFNFSDFFYPVLRHPLCPHMLVPGHP